MRWGLIPHWAKDKSIGQRLINARADSLHEKTAFRSAFAKRRCLIPADGFYEWRTENGKKQPYRISRRDGRPFAFAGLWESASLPALLPERGDEMLESCTIVTTQANGLVAPYHDRMPVLLDKEQFADWLDPNQAESEAARLLVPYGDEGLVVEPVNPKVGNPRYEDPDCVLPLAETGLMSASPHVEKQSTLWD